MDKQKIYIEHVLRSRSARIIWPLISRPEGMGKWIADEVKEDGGGRLSFRWGETWSSHEIRTATVVEVVEMRHIIIRWDDEDDEEVCLKLALEKSDLTGDYVLTITDFAASEDADSLREVWNSCLTRLRRTTGL